MNICDRVPMDNCTGCAACVFRCPQGAVAMMEDAEGFLYPRIDDRKCISCGNCADVCPVKTQSDGSPHSVKSVYAAWTKDLKLLRQSTSGGMFSEVARIILDDGGVVFGAAYDREMAVRHTAVEQWDALKALRGSKYVQSDVGDTYAQAEHYLKNGRRVLYSGTPCQIAGLYAVVGKEHENLLTCGLICHGVPSPKVFRMAIASIERKKRSKVDDFQFRNKSIGWLYPTICIRLASGKAIKESHRDNPFNLGFSRDIYLRPACYQCPMKRSGPIADITLGDFFQLLKHQPTMINREGTSVVLVHSDRGQHMTERAEKGVYLKRCPAHYLGDNSHFFRSAKLPGDREAFFKDLDILSFEALTKKYIKPRIKILKLFASVRRLILRYMRGR